MGGISTKRIASLLASSTEMLFGLGLGDRVVAISHECDYPAAALDRPRVTRPWIDDSIASEQIDVEVKQRLATGQPLYEIDVALLARLAPELIVTQAQCEVCAISYEDVCGAVAREPALQKSQILTLKPNSLEDVFHDTQMVAVAAGDAAAGKAYVAQLRQRTTNIVNAVCGKPTEGVRSAGGTQRRPRVAIVEWIEPMMLSGNWLPELVEQAGGRHELTSPGAASPCVAWDKLVRYAPEILIIAPCGFDVSRTLREMELLRQQPGWSELPAVRDRRVYVVDGNAYINRAGPRLVDTLELLAHLIQPDRCDSPTTLAEGSDWQQVVLRHSWNDG